MAGPVVLCGGNEFEQASYPLNQALLRLTGQKRAHVVILPVAASENPRKAALHGVGHFKSLHADVEALMIAGGQAANDAILSAGMETAQVIYLTDGNPLAVVQGLQETETLSRLRYFWSRGCVLGASGAGAMALCDFFWDGGLWDKGLGLLKGIVVLPHYQLVAGRFSPARLRQGLAPDYTILGLDDSTGALISGQEVEVAGPESVTVYRADSESEYHEGDRFTLAGPIA